MAGLADAVRENREKVRLVAYLVGIVAFAALLSPMLGEAWQRAGLSRLLFRTLAVFGFGLGPASSLILGVFFSSLLLMIYDTKKRLQGVLLFGGSVIGLLLLASQGLLLANIDFGATVEWLAIGLVCGVVVGGGRQLVSSRDTHVLELRRASRTVFYMLSAVVVGGFLEYHLEYPVPVGVTPNGGFVLTGLSQPFAVQGGAQQIAFNLLLVGGFVLTTKRFVQYDAQKNFLVLGPKASGKSLLLVGAYLEALERFSGDSSSTTPLNPSQDLMNLVGQLDQQQEGWFVSATRTQELETLRFQYVHGSVFPLNIQVSGLDYAGEWLEEIPDVLVGAKTEENVPTTLARVAGAVAEADTLVLVVDCERYVNDEPLGIEPYFEILQARENADVVLVATKADVMAERFRDDRGLNAEQYFDDFQQFVNDRLRGNQTVQSLVAQSAGSTIHPVFYQTRVDDRGERVPMRNSGSVATVGFDRLLETLGESE